MPKSNKEEMKIKMTWQKGWEILMGGHCHVVFINET